MLTKNFETLKTEVAAHIAADAVIAGYYWNEDDNAVGGQGCFIGCLAHSDRAEDVVSRFGLPLPLVSLCEDVFEALPPDEGKAFFASLPEAVGSDGKDLSLVHWAFLASELRALPSGTPYAQSVIDPVIAGMDLLSGGSPWPNAASAARAASRAANSAYAARAATYAANAASAARAAAYAYAAESAAAESAADAAKSAAAESDAAAAESAADAASAAAESADAESVFAAESAESAAKSAAESVANVARAAYAAAESADKFAAKSASYAARIRQRNTLLKLISEAPSAN